MLDGPASGVYTFMQYIKLSIRLGSIFFFKLHLNLFDLGLFS